MLLHYKSSIINEDMPNYRKNGAMMMTHKELYYILTFDTTTDAMCADKCVKNDSNNIQAALMPLPQEFKSGCGLALRFLEENLNSILNFCSNAPFNGRLYKLYTKRINGHHPIDPVSLTSFDFSE